MKTMRTALTAAATVGLVLGIGIAPAQADNPVLNDNWASAKYIDNTDQLCARVGANFGNGFWAEALIRKDGTTVKSKLKVGNHNGSWACTANLSIPEDQPYTLMLRSCTEHSLPSCTVKRNSFFS